MKILDIRSSELPEIDDSVKDCVNNGLWLLFKPESTEAFDASAQASVVYCLKAGARMFGLSANGSVVSVIDRSTSVGIRELVTFSDVPKPAALSNFALTA